MFQKTKTIVDANSKYHMPIMVEMHSSYWLEDMRNYTVKDFMKGGVICENPEVLKGDATVIEKLKKAGWNVIPVLKDFVEKRQACSNFIYLKDSEDGLYIWHHEPLR